MIVLAMHIYFYIHVLCIFQKALVYDVSFKFKNYLKTVPVGVTGDKYDWKKLIKIDGNCAKLL